MMDFKVDGVATLEQVGRALKAQDAKELRKELFRGINAATKPAKVKIKAAALSQLPQRGGLARLVASSTISSSNRLSGKNPGIRLTGKKIGSDRGVVRHPVFGSDRWVTQRVQGGFFTKTLEAEAPEVRKEIKSVLDDMAKRLAKGDK